MIPLAILGFSLAELLGIGLVALLVIVVLVALFGDTEMLLELAVEVLD
jgi:hypothetical protein